MNNATTNCPFCALNKSVTRVVKDGVHCVVILSNPRLMRGHLLVIPKRHVEKISDLRPGEKRELWEMTEEFQEKIVGTLGNGCDIRQHHRPFQQQDALKIDHLHIHLQPRELYDKLYQVSQVHEKDIFRDLSDNEAHEVLDSLQN